MACWLIVSKQQAGVHPQGELLFALPDGPLPKGMPGKFHCFLVRDRNSDLYPKGSRINGGHVLRKIDLDTISSNLSYCLAAKPFTPTTWTILERSISEEEVTDVDCGTIFPVSFEGGYRITPFVDDPLRFLIGEDAESLRRLITPSRPPQVFGGRRLSRYLPR